MPELVEFGKGMYAALMTTNKKGCILQSNFQMQRGEQDKYIYDDDDDHRGGYNFSSSTIFDVP